MLKKSLLFALCLTIPAAHQSAYAHDGREHTEYQTYPEVSSSLYEVKVHKKAAATAAAVSLGVLAGGGAYWWDSRRNDGNDRFGSTVLGSAVGLGTGILTYLMARAILGDDNFAAYKTLEEKFNPLLRKTLKSKLYKISPEDLTEYVEKIEDKEELSEMLRFYTCTTLTFIWYKKSFINIASKTNKKELRDKCGTFKRKIASVLDSITPRTKIIRERMLYVDIKQAACDINKKIDRILSSRTLQVVVDSYDATVAYCLSLPTQEIHSQDHTNFEVDDIFGGIFDKTDQESPYESVPSIHPLVNGVNKLRNSLGSVYALINNIEKNMDVCLDHPDHDGYKKLAVEYKQLHMKISHEFPSALFEQRIKEISFTDEYKEAYKQQVQQKQHDEIMDKLYSFERRVDKKLSNTERSISDQINTLDSKTNRIDRKVSNLDRVIGRVRRDVRRIERNNRR